MFTFENISLVSVVVLPMAWGILPQKVTDNTKAFIRRHRLLKGILVLLVIVFAIYAFYMATHDDLMTTEGLMRGSL